MRFAESFPILSARKELRWAYPRALITVPDEKERLRQTGLPQSALRSKDGSVQHFGG
jgi:hypothetical protein